MNNVNAMGEVLGTIKCLKSMEKTPDTEETINYAIYWLEKYMDDLTTASIENIPFHGDVIHLRKKFPVYDAVKTDLDYWTEEIKAEFEVHIDNMLRNYEENYGLEPLLVKDFVHYVNSAPYAACGYPDNRPLILNGYKIYKKDLNRKEFK